jgi:hypothetical protein
MRVYVCFVVLMLPLVFSSSTSAGSRLSATATIQATAQVVPPVGVEAYAENDRIGAPDDESQLFWIHAPRPGGVYVTMTDASGRTVCAPSLRSLSTLEQHRYRSLVCLEPGTSLAEEDQPYILTVVYSAD